MKIVQVINNAGQTNGQGLMWDSVSNEVSTLQWAWPASSNRNRIVDRVRAAGDAIGVRWQQRESDGNSFLDRQFVSFVGATPGAIESAIPAADAVPYYDGIVSWLADKAFTIASRLSSYAVYDFTGPASCVVGALGSFPYDGGGLSGVNYSDGSLRLVSINVGTATMYLSTPLDGSPLNMAASLPLTLPVAPSATNREAIAAGCAQLLRLFAAAPGTPIKSPAWQMYRFSSSEYDTRTLDDQSSFSPNSAGDSRVQFVERDQQSGADVAVTLMVDPAGIIKSAESVPVQAVDVSIFSRWYLIGDDGSPPLVKNFWRNFVRSFEDLDAA
jgi:hypothetical protein